MVTNMGVMKFDDLTKEMYLAEYYPGVAPEKIAETTGFPIDLSRAVEFEAPTKEELRILREKVDPQRLILGGAGEQLDLKSWNVEKPREGFCSQKGTFVLWRAISTPFSLKGAGGILARRRAGLNQL